VISGYSRLMRLLLEGLIIVALAPSSSLCVLVNLIQMTQN